MRSNKSQVTLFVIIGLLILIAIVFLFLAKNYVLSVTYMDSVGQVNDKISSYDKYYTYVESCVDQATREGLILVGMQGGPIYDYEAPGGKAYLGPSNGYPYGKYILPYDVDGIVYNVSYGLRMPQLGSTYTYHPDIPFYPYGLAKLVSNPKVINPRFTNMFGNFPGEPPMPPLCDYFGQNRPGQTLSVSCERYDSTSPASKDSIQEYLESFIANRTLRCITLEKLPELSDQDIVKGPVTANVTFGEDHVFVDVQVPLKIKLSMFKSVIQIKDIHVSYPVRLKKIYELASHLIVRDSNDIFFNIVTDASTLNDCKDITGGNAACLKPGMKVSKISDPCTSSGLCTSGNYDNILVIQDNDSRINGIPYQFQVAIQNRPPALDLISKEVGSGSFYYDYITFLGDTITIDPKGYDPDENQHNSQGFMDNYYYYEGWRQDYYDVFKLDRCTYNQLTDESCLDKVEVAPDNWASSALYQSTKRMASYKTTKTDLGVHKLKVKVCDEDPNSCDWQIVVIFVLNGTFATGYNDYGIPGFASLEDPFHFNSPVKGEDLDPSLPGYMYKWRAEDEAANPVFTKTTLIENLTLPGAADPYDINSIWSILTGTDYFSGLDQNYSLYVDIYDNTGNQLLRQGSDPNIISVKQCLPYRSSSPPYPYNTTADPFFGNHSCCYGDPTTPEELNWGTVLDSSNICFKDTEYGCRDDSSFKDFSSASGPTPTIVTNEPADADANDVYKRTFTRNCDGTRGNICNGNTVVDTRTFVQSCGVCQTCSYGSPGCVDLPLGTICNTSYACSGGEGSPYPSSGPFSCQGSCNTGSCNTASKCVCNKGCGAECTVSGPQDYQWTDRQCLYNCNDYKDSGTTDCSYHGDTGAGYLKCSSPDSANTAACESRTINGVDYLVCPGDPSYTSTIDSATGPYLASSCKYSDNYCYVDSCTGEGPYEEMGEYCPDAGTVIDAPDTTKDDQCYYNPLGSVGCATDGKCEDHMPFSDILNKECDTGSPLTGNCTDGNTCYNATCNPYTGWIATADTDVTVGGATYTCGPWTGSVSCNNGFGSHILNDMCVYNITCTQDGWKASEQACPQTSATGTDCNYHPRCAIDGCHYDSLDSSQESCTAPMTNVCTSSGWKCQ